MNKLSTKILIWHGLVALCAWRLFLLSDNMEFNGVTGLDINLPSFGWFLWTIALIAVGYMLFSRRHFSASISGVIGLLFLIFIGFSWLNFLAVAIFWVLNVWAEERAMSDMKGRIKMKIPKTLVSVLFPVVLGFFIMASFGAYQSDFADQIKTQDQLPSQAEVFIRNAVDKMFGSKLGPDNSKERQMAVNEVSSGTFQSINDFLRPYFRWSPPALAFGLFLLLWGLSWIFVYTGVVGGLIIFWILKKTKVVRIEERDVKAEVLVV